MWIIGCVRLVMQKKLAKEGRQHWDRKQLRMCTEWAWLCCGCLMLQPYLVCHNCIWYVMSISGMSFPYLVCYSHHGWLVQPSVALKKKKNSNPPCASFHSTSKFVISLLFWLGDGISQRHSSGIATDHFQIYNGPLVSCLHKIYEWYQILIDCRMIGQNCRPGPWLSGLSIDRSQWSPVTSHLMHSNMSSNS